MELLPIPEKLAPFVKDISYDECSDSGADNSFPFYADGFPGIIYSTSKNPFYLQPANLKLCDFYLYGQTLEPISLDIKGEFEMVLLRLYPFAVRILLGVDPKVLNDRCHDLMRTENIDTQSTLDKLRKTKKQDEIVDIIADYMDELVKNASVNPDYTIKLATNMILKANGDISIKEVRDRLYITERTLERNILKEIGVTAKQFAKIIQFSTSMNQITDAEFLNLTEIGYENGFSDQSHFIRTFKKFTGKTPKEFQNQFAF